VTLAPSLKSHRMVEARQFCSQPFHFGGFVTPRPQAKKSLLIEGCRNHVFFAAQCKSNPQLMTSIAGPGRTTAGKQRHPRDGAAS